MHAGSDSKIGADIHTRTLAEEFHFENMRATAIDQAHICISSHRAQKKIQFDNDGEPLGRADGGIASISPSPAV